MQSVTLLIHRAVFFVLAVLSILTAQTAHATCDPYTDIKGTIQFNYSNFNQSVFVIKNNSRTCTYVISDKTGVYGGVNKVRIGVASYKVFTPISIQSCGVGTGIDDQEYVGSIRAFSNRNNPPGERTLTPGQSISFGAWQYAPAFPNCYFQLDMYIGAAIGNFRTEGWYCERKRLLDSVAHVNGGVCRHPTPAPTRTPVPAPTRTPTPRPTATPVPTVGTLSCDAGGPYTDIPCQTAPYRLTVNGRARSSDNKPVALNWKTNCPQGSFDNAWVNPATLNLRTTANNGAPVSCQVSLTVNNSARALTCVSSVTSSQCRYDCRGVLNGPATLDRCGVCQGDGQSCLNCSLVDIQAEQRAIDISAARARSSIQHAASILARSLPLDRKARSLAKSVSKKSNAIYVETWQVAYTSLAGVMKVCANNSFCQSISNQSALGVLSGNAKKLTSLANSLLTYANRKSAQLNRSSFKRIKSHVEKARRYGVTVAKEVAKVPPQTSSCS